MTPSENLREKIPSSEEEYKASGLQGSELVQAYQGLANQYNDKISELQKTPGNEELIKKYQEDLTKVYKQGAKVHLGTVYGEPSTYDESKIPVKQDNPIRRGLARLYESPDYQMAYPSDQRAMRESAYDNYIVPYYKKHLASGPFEGPPLPDRNYFIDNILPDTQQPSDQVVWRGLLGARVETFKYLRGFWDALSWAGAYYMGRPTPMAEIKKQPVHQWIQRHLDESENWYGQYYAEDRRSNIVSGIMSTAPSAVTWSLISGGLGEIVEGLGAASKAAGITGKVADYIKDTPVEKYAPVVWNRFVQRRVDDLISGYLTGRLRGETPEEARSGAYWAAGIGTAIEGLQGGIGGTRKLFSKILGYQGTRGVAKGLRNAINTASTGATPTGGPPPPPSGEGGVEALKGFRRFIRYKDPKAPTGPIVTPPPGQSTPTSSGIPAPTPAPTPTPAPVPSGVTPTEEFYWRLLNQAVHEVSGGKASTWADATEEMRTSAMQHIAHTVGESIPDAITANPGLIEADAKAQIAEHAAQSPEFAKLIDSMSAASGQSAAKNVADHVVDMHEAETTWSRLRELMKGIGPGAASAQEKELLNNVRNIVKSNFKLQNKKHQVAFVWSVRDALPEDVKSVVAQAMKQEFGDKPKAWDMAARNLEIHIDRMIRTKHIKPFDLRGVFRSTNLLGSPTKWQRQLKAEDDALMAAMKKTIKKISPKSDPRLDEITEPTKTKAPKKAAPPQPISQDVLGQTVMMLSKLGYSPADMQKMTFDQLRDVIANQTQKGSIGTPVPKLAVEPAAPKEAKPSTAKPAKPKTRKPSKEELEEKGIPQGEGARAPKTAKPPAAAKPKLAVEKPTLGQLREYARRMFDQQYELLDAEDKLEVDTWAYDEAVKKAKGRK